MTWKGDLLLLFILILVFFMFKKYRPNEAFLKLCCLMLFLWPWCWHFHMYQCSQFIKTVFNLKYFHCFFYFYLFIFYYIMNKLFTTPLITLLHCMCYYVTGTIIFFLKFAFSLSLTGRKVSNKKGELQELVEHFNEGPNLHIFTTLAIILKTVNLQCLHSFFF